MELEIILYNVLLTVRIWACNWHKQSNFDYLCVKITHGMKHVDILTATCSELIHSSERTRDVHSTIEVQRILFQLHMVP